MFFSSGLWYIDILMVNGQWSLTLLFRIALLLNTCFHIIYYPLIKLQTLKNSHGWNGKKLTWSQTISIWSKQNIDISILSFVFVKHRIKIKSFLASIHSIRFGLFQLYSWWFSSETPSSETAVVSNYWGVFLVHPSHKQGRSSVA